MNSIHTTSPLAHGLSDLRSLTNTPALQPDASAGAQAADDFATVLKGMLTGVNQSQQDATRLAESFDEGQEQNLAGVMIAQQKARLSFQTTLQVRNKIISAYQDIMNMPI
jgi:flagellar hook-basal body complex protein FliE